MEEHLAVSKNLTVFLAIFEIFNGFLVILGKSVDEAMEWNNEVEQGLSSSLFTQNIGNIFKVL